MLGSTLPIVWYLAQTHARGVPVKSEPLGRSPWSRLSRIPRFLAKDRFLAKLCVSMIRRAAGAARFARLKILEINPTCGSRRYRDDSREISHFRKLKKKKFSPFFSSSEKETHCIPMRGALHNLSAYQCARPLYLKLSSRTSVCFTPYFTSVINY